MGDYYVNKSEPVRTRPFEPKDNAIPLDSVDWKRRYDELKNTKDWDPIKDFVGLKRLGSSYHPLDPFFKFDGIPPENLTFDRIWYPLIGGVGGLLTGAFSNWWSRRPFLSAIIPTITCGAVGLGIGLYCWNSSRRRARERDAVLIHYMILHENDFPRIERKRFGEIVKPWYPNRLGVDGWSVEK